MRNVEFRHFLNHKNALRVRFTIDEGHVLQFIVQFECLFSDNWALVVRYDTVHGFAHCDKLHPYEPAEKITMVTQNYNEALTFAINDLTDNWNRYRRRYEEWLHKK